MDSSNRTHVRAVILRAVSSEAQASEDKVSLEVQNTECLKYCDKKGYTVIANLEIPGFSRYDSDLENLFAEFRKQGVRAFDELAALFRQRGVDVLVGYHPSRLGRSMVLFTWVVENIVRAGGRVEFVKGGEINAQNLPLANAMSAYAATDGVQKLVADKKAGMRKRAELGLPMGSKIPFFHIAPRDERGRQTRMVVNREHHGRLIDDLYDLVVNQQVTWNSLEPELCKRGHVTGDGSQYAWHFFHAVMHTPSFWGHIAVGYSAKTQAAKNRYQLWLLDETLASEVPSGVEMFYNVCESVYEGERRVRLMAELHRRYWIVRGRAQTRSRNAFSNLLLCEECGKPLSYTGNTAGYRGYRCDTRYTRKFRTYSYGSPDCSQTKYIRFDTIRDWFDERLRNAMTNHSVKPLLMVNTQGAADNQLTKLRKELAKAEKNYATLSMRVADAPTEALDGVWAAIRSTANERDAIKHQIAMLELQHTINEQSLHASTLAASDILGYGSEFWQLPENEIHQMLHLLLGRWRLVVSEGEIIGVIETER